MYIYYISEIFWRTCFLLLCKDMVFNELLSSMCRKRYKRYTKTFWMMQYKRTNSGKLFRTPYSLSLSVFLMHLLSSHESKIDSLYALSHFCTTILPGEWYNWLHSTAKTMDLIQNQCCFFPLSFSSHKNPVGTAVQLSVLLEIANLYIW